MFQGRLAGNNLVVGQPLPSTHKQNDLTLRGFPVLALLSLATHPVCYGALDNGSSFLATSASNDEKEKFSTHRSFSCTLRATSRSEYLARE